MLNLSENSCYLTVVRPPKKSIQHCWTSSTQIERASFDLNHTTLQYSIRHSKMLKQYKQKFPFFNPFDHSQCQQIFTTKNIHQDKSKFYVGKVLKQLHCTQFGIVYVQKLKKQKYDVKNERHQNQLLSIWSNLKPDQKLKSRVSDQWINVGFQVSDPSTDFRGAGSLGLLNLYRFSSKQKCKKIFQVAIGKQTSYFFCSAGLFFTMLASDLQKQKKIDYDFWVHKDQQELLDKFQIIYQMLFSQFNNYWIQKCQNKSIMYFNQNLKNFQKIVKSWSSKQMKGRIKDYLQ